MAGRRRNRAPTARVAGRPNGPRQSINGTVNSGRHQNSKFAKKIVKVLAKGRGERGRVAKSEFARNLENVVSQDPKLNGNLVPTVALESSTRTPTTVRKRNSLLKQSVSPPKLSNGLTNRPLRTRNPAPEALPNPNRDNPKMYKTSKEETLRVEPKRSLNCLNMLAPVFADCKLNGASAPRVVLKRLDVEQLLQNGITSVAPQEEISKQNFPPNRDLKSRIKSRSRLKAIGKARNHVPPKTNIGKLRRKKKEGPNFKRVPYHEEKWWNSYPLRQVAVRLTKLPLLIN